MPGRVNPLRASGGYFLPDPQNPFADMLPKRKVRDAKSGRPQQDPTILCLRVPKPVMHMLRIKAQQEQITVTIIVLRALKAELQPEIIDQTSLRDGVSPAPVFLGQNQRAARLENEIKPTVSQPVPEWDHMGRWKQREAKKRGDRVGLVDKPRR
jgi:hypothetical protein